MNRKILVSAALLAGGGIAAWLLRKNQMQQNKDNGHTPKQRHLTDTFARAKHQAMEGM